MCTDKWQRRKIKKTLDVSPFQHFTCAARQFRCEVLLGQFVLRTALVVYFTYLLITQGLTIHNLVMNRQQWNKSDAFSYQN